MSHPHPSVPFTRRRFLHSAVGAAGLLMFARATSADSSPPLVRTTHALGTAVSITAVGVAGDSFDRAVNAAWKELEAIESVLSIYRPDSQLCRLNHTGRITDAHPHLLTVLASSLDMSRRTDGAFDVSVQRLWAAYARAAKDARLPTDDECQSALSKINWRNIHVEGSTVSLRDPGMALTFNGIAQGYATDRVRAVLKQTGVEHALVDVGELAPLGEKSPHYPWTCGIQHPRNEDAYAAVVKLEGRCLATSGDYATRFLPNRDEHHILDPSTGHSPTLLSSVSIAAPTAMLADALSTAVFVLGPEKGLDLIRQTPDTDALLILRDGTVSRSPGFPLAS